MQCPGEILLGLDGAFFKGKQPREGNRAEITSSACHKRCNGGPGFRSISIFGAHLYTYPNFCNVFVFLRFTTKPSSQISVFTGKTEVSLLRLSAHGWVYVFFRPEFDNGTRCGHRSGPDDPAPCALYKVRPVSD